MQIVNSFLNNKDFKHLLENNLIPAQLSPSSKAIFKDCINLYNEGHIECVFNEIICNESFYELIENNEYKKFGNTPIDFNTLSENIELSEGLKMDILDEFLKCDYNRVKIEPYDLKRLEDPNLGHWDLWENVDDNINKMKLKTETAFIGRNPVSDIKHDGIIGIDFGTRSTIVVYQDSDDNTRPMRIGRGEFSKALRQDDFENPTVMEFIDLENFLKCYLEKFGRPNTSWEDLTISHTAMNSLFSLNTKSDDYYSFFNDLKQWSGDKTRKIRLRDKQGIERVLPAFADINEGDFNPIEIYAYYLGLFINNMYNGVYLKYILSFPVTYEKEVRTKIIQSFEYGLKKSLPNPIVKNEEIMEKFRVIQGASEPAAYAICALQQYGFEPEENEEIFYGIFDFGGGTTDFDFGIWRCANNNESRYDYVINHFGAGGDQYLGGENLLEFLAYEVFKSNSETLIAEKISFYKPTECKIFPGSEMLVSESQEAKLNIKQLMEKLRPLWEEHENYEKLFTNDVIKVMLFDKDGNPKPNFELKVNKDQLENLLKNRIEKGVKNFFEALKLTFESDITTKQNGIKIFLAGNSSKSKFVKEIFNEYINEYTAAICEKLGCVDSEKEYFTIYPPLGTIEAIEIQKAKGIFIDETDLTKPTGKTGVAYGLIECRPGSRIKVISEKQTSEEIKFKYYIGHNVRKKFKPVIDRNIPYNKWVKFIDATEEDFELYYTNLPEATTNQLDSKDLNKKMCRIKETDKDAYVYLRAISPTVIEFVVSNEDLINEDRFLGVTQELELK